MGAHTRPQDRPPACPVIMQHAATRFDEYVVSYTILDYGRSVTLSLSKTRGRRMYRCSCHDYMYYRKYMVKSQSSSGPKTGPSIDPLRLL